MQKAHLNPKCLLSSFAYYESCLQSRTTYSHISFCKLSSLRFSLCELCAMVEQWRVLGLGGRWQADYGVETSCVSMFLPSALASISARLPCDILVLPPCAGLWWAQGSTWCVRRESWDTKVLEMCLLSFGLQGVCLGSLSPLEELRHFLLPLKKASWWDLKSHLKCHHFMLSIFYWS